MFRNLFKKKSKVRFHSLNPAVTNLYPLIHSSKLDRPWVDQEKEDYKQRLSRCPFHFVMDNEISSINKCPAINSIMSHGYILRSPVDVGVRYDGEILDTRSANCVLPDFPGGALFSSIHSKDVSKWLLDSSKDNSAPYVLKVNTPWRVTTNNPDIVFLVTKVPFVNESRFSAVMGILDPRLSMEMNCQLMWHVPPNPEDIHVIKAGTPLCMYLPLDRKILQTPFECVDADETDLKVDQEMKYLVDHSSKHLFNQSERFAATLDILRRRYGLYKKP